MILNMEFYKRNFSEPGFVRVTAATDGPDQVAVIYHFISKQWKISWREHILTLPVLIDF